MRTWFDIKETPLQHDNPVLVRQKGGVKSFACWHATNHASGIIELKPDDDKFKWDGRTYLLFVTHWSEIVPEDFGGAVANSSQQP